MSIELAISLLLVPILWALAEWRLGLLLCLATAILQDPLRKLTPDQPVLFVVFVGIVFAAACIGAWARGISLGPKMLIKPYRELYAPLVLLSLLVIVQAFHSYLRFENLLIPLIGLLTYVLPLPAIVFAYQLVLREGDLRVTQFIKWYAVCMTLSLTTVYLEFSGYSWPILGQVGPSLLIFDKTTGAIVPSISGLFRASEIAGWHAMSAACFVLMLTSLRRATLKRFLTAMIVVLFLIAVGLLTGRRKIVVQLAVFVCAYSLLWAIFEKRVGKLAIILLTTASMAVYMGLAAEVEDDVLVQSYKTDIDYSLYVERTQRVFQDAPSRFLELGIAPVMWAYESFGLFGAGLGSGTQGTQHFGGGGQDMGAAEGGLGKITLELGVPGLFVMTWFGIAVFRCFWRIMRAASRHSLRIGRLSYGLCSLLVANVAGFSVATQAYSDLFLLLILGWTFGFLLAIPLLVGRGTQARQMAIVDGPANLLQPKAI